MSHGGHRAAAGLLHRREPDRTERWRQRRQLRPASPAGRGRARTALHRLGTRGCASPGGSGGPPSHRRHDRTVTGCWTRTQLAPPPGTPISTGTDSPTPTGPSSSVGPSGRATSGSPASCPTATGAIPLESSGARRRRRRPAAAPRPSTTRRDLALVGPGDPGRAQARKPSRTPRKSSGTSRLKDMRSPLRGWSKASTRACSSWWSTSVRSSRMCTGGVWRSR